MIRTQLPICVVAIALVLASACDDNIGDPSETDQVETDEIETNDGGTNVPPGETVEDGSVADGAVADAGPDEDLVDSGPEPCPAGYVRDMDGCVDIDECSMGNGGCGEIGRATCVNNVGGAPACGDVNECLTNNGNCGDAANYECVNRDRIAPTCVDLNACGTNNGGCGDPAFNRCSYDTDGVAVCSDINECETNNGGCGDVTAMTCVNPLGAKNTCEDIDECSSSSLNDCPADKPCVNVKGSYFCGCDYPAIFDAVSASCRPVRVLVLDDAGATTLLSDLRAEGFAATDGGLYYTWNQSPDLSAFDTVLWLEGKNYGNPLLPGMDQLLVDFVRSGGGLVRTEWGLWYTANRRKLGQSINPLTVDLMPVGLLASDDYGDSAGTWTVTAPGSPLARGLPSEIATTGGYTLLELLPGSEVVATAADVRTPMPVPVLSYTAIHGGITVHVNDTLLYPNGTRTAIEPEIKQVYFNAVHFSAQRPLD